MTNKEIFDFIDRFERGGLQTMKLRSGDFSIELTRAAAAPGAAAPVAPQPAEDADVVKAPLVGVFYEAPGPGEKPFVQVGDRVSRGQTLCLMEAMKTLSEVCAPCDCVITQVLKENGQLAAFDEPLFRYRPC